MDNRKGDLNRGSGQQGAGRGRGYNNRGDRGGFGGRGDRGGYGGQLFRGDRGGRGGRGGRGESAIHGVNAQQSQSQWQSWATQQQAFSDASLASGVREMRIDNKQKQETPEEKEGRKKKEGLARDAARAERDKNRQMWLAAEDSFPIGKMPLANGDRILGNYFVIKFLQPNVRLHKYGITLPTLGKADKPPQKPEVKRPLIVNLLEENRPSADHWASDYDSFIVSREPLFKEWQGMTLGQCRTLDHHQTFRTGSQDQRISITTTLTLESMVDLTELEAHCRTNNQGRISIDRLNEYLKILNAISWKRINGPSQDGINVKVKNKFYPTSLDSSQYSKDLGVYLIRTGFFTSIRPGQDQLLLNVNPTTSAFYSPSKLSEWMAAFWENKNLEQLRREFVRHLRGVKVTFEPEENGVHRRIWSLGTDDINTQKFQLNGKDITVFDHLNGKYGSGKHQFDKSSLCINLSSGEPKWYPADKLRIVEWQVVKTTLDSRFTSLMLGCATRRPQQNRDLIKNTARFWLGLEDSAFYHGFNIQPAQDFLPIRAQARLRSIVRNSSSVSGADTGSWNLKGNSKFYKIAGQNFRPKKYLRILWTFQSPEDAASSTNRLRLQFVRYGFLQDSSEVVNGHVSSISQLKREHCVNKLREANARFQNDQESLPVLIVVIGDKEIYPDVKWWADCYAGIPTVCITQKVLATASPDTCANIAMKVNFKMQGINHRIHDDWCGYGNSIMFVGADVTHPAKGSENCPSIAGIVATRDANCCHYLGSARLQSPKTEYIEDLGSMIKERVIAWYRHAKNFFFPGLPSFPHTICLYRDGVSESQYGMVLKQERPQIREGWDAAVGYLEKNEGLSLRPNRPKEIVIVVTKRHHSRFYPEKASLHPGVTRLDPNLPCGTAVNTGVLNPTTFGFHLQSHESGLGTARNGLYTLIYTDLEMKQRTEAENLMRKLETMTYNLCFTGSRATKSLSIVTPARYADLLCDRLRLYMKPALDKKVILGANATLGPYAKEPGLWMQPRQNPHAVPAEPERKNPWHPNLDEIMFYL